MGTWKYSIATGVRYNDFVYFYDYLSTKLFRMDMNNGSLEIAGLFYDPHVESALYGNAIAYSNKAWFLPNQALDIAELDLESGDIKYLPIDYSSFNRDAYDNLPVKFKQIAGTRGKEAYFVSPCMGDVVVLNMEKGELRYIHNTVNTQTELMGMGTVVKDDLWMFPLEGRKAKRLNLENNIVEEFDWDISEGEYAYAITYGQKVILSPGKKQAVMIFDTESMKKEMYTIPMEFAGEARTSAARMIGSRLYMARCCPDNGILTFDIESKEFALIKKPDQNRDWRWLSFIYESVSDEVMISTNADGCLLRIGKNGDMDVLESKYDREKIFKSALKASGDDYKVVRKIMGVEDGIVKEDQLRFEDYMKLI